MEQLLEDYKRRLETINSEIEKLNNSTKTLRPGGPIFNLENEIKERLTTKASCYRTFVSELEREIRIQKEEIKSETSFGK